ncbi:MAG: restriction endonuclease subunit S [Halarcobacter sp.]
MIGTLDSQVIEKFKEFQDKTGNYKQLKLEDIEFKQEILDKLIDIFDSQRVPLSTIERNKRKGKYPYYGASGIIDYIDDFIFDGKYLIISEDGENLRSRKTPIAFWAIGQFWVNNHAHIVLGKENILYTDYLRLFISSNKLSNFISNSSQPKLSQGNLQKIPIPLPKDYNEQYKSIDIQKAIVEFLEFWKINYTDVFRQTVTHQKPILEKIKKALIPGTLRYDKTIVNSFNEFAKSNNYKIKLEEVTFKKIDFFNIKKNDLLSPKKLEKNQNLILLNSSNNGYPVYSGAIEPLCKVDESKYPNKIFVPNHQNLDISFANNGDGSAGRNFFVHTDKYFVNQERTVISFKNDNDFYSLYILNQIINMRDKYNMNRENRPTPKDLPKFGIEITLPFHNTVSSFDIQKILVQFWEMILNNIDERFTKFDNIERLTDKIDEAFLYRTFSKIEWREE